MAGGGVTMYLLRWRFWRLFLFLVSSRLLHPGTSLCPVNEGDPLPSWGWEISTAWCVAAIIHG